MNTSTIVKFGSKVGLVVATVAGLGTVPGSAQAADPAGTQGAPSFTRFITATTTSRAVTARMQVRSFTSSVDPISGSPGFQRYQYWNTLTCIGGSQFPGGNPLTGFFPNTDGPNNQSCSGGIAWAVGLVDLT